MSGRREQDIGAALVLALGYMGIISIFAGIAAHAVWQRLDQDSARIHRAEARGIAEAGLELTRAALADRSRQLPQTEGRIEAGRYLVHVEAVSGGYEVLAIGIVSADSGDIAREELRVLLDPRGNIVRRYGWGKWSNVDADT